MNRPIRVLMIEDSATDAKLIIHALRSPGSSLELERVEDAAALRAALEQKSWDVVLSDWSLPTFSALAALEIVKSSGIDLPFIIVSGTIGEESAVQAMRAGARDYVLKGNLVRLRAAVERELSERADREARREAERTARAQETRFRALIENSADAITLTARDGTLLYLSPAMARMLGTSTEHLLGSPGAHFIHPDDRQHVAGVMRRIREPDAPSVTLQFRALHRDGSCLWLEAVATNMLDEPSVGAIVGNVRNITEQRRAIEELRSSELRFARLSEAGIVGIVVADVLGNTFEANDAFLHMVGYTRADLLAGALEWRAMTPPEWREADEASIQQLMTRGVASSREKEMFRKDGSRVPLLLGVAMLEYPKCIAFVADLSERKIAERALRASELQLRQAQKMEAVGLLAGGIAHDFNNLLSVILGFSDLMLSDLEPTDSRCGDLQQICAAGKRAADLTRQLLMFSRQQIVEPKVLDLNELVLGMDKMLHRLLGEDVDLESIPAPALGRVRADPGSIEQVVMNLVVNARDAMPTGGKLTMETANIELDDDYASTHQGVKPGSYVMLAVSDTGTGMDKETQSRIFEPFFTTKEQGKGTGLGLSTVFGIVQQSDGNIGIYSEPGKGTTFKVYLPRVDAPVEELKRKVAPVDRRGSETILLVEDEDQVRLVARGILRKHGYDVMEARSAAEALLLCERQSGRIHLLLTDVVMPIMSGPELAKRLGHQWPDMKVLCMSGHTDNAALRHGVIDSGTAYLQKPLTVDTLTRKVREVLDSSPNS
jgi:PAS domain S-box-containing protein